MLPEKCVDLTLLKPDARLGDFIKLCAEAKENSEIVRGVCVLPDPLVIETCAKELEESGILVSCVNDFPFGRGGWETKEKQAEIARHCGADEIDTVINVAALRDGRDEIILKEIENIATIFVGDVKVILETGHPWYGKSLIKKATKLVFEAGAFCVKTSTGFVANIPVEEKVKHVRWMHEAEPDLKIKVAGGIKTIRDAELFLNIPGLSADNIIFGASAKFWLEK